MNAAARTFVVSLRTAKGRGRKSETDVRMSVSDVAGTDTALFSAWHRVCSKISEGELGGAKMSDVVMKSVTLSRGLKEKNRLAGKLAQLREQISGSNSHEAEVPQDVDVTKAMAEAKEVEQRLIAVKTALAKANAEIVGTIIALEEVKSEIVWLKGLNTKEGTFKSRSYGETTVEVYKTTIHGAEKLAMIDELQKRANRLQDELDDFNSSHRITIEVEVE